MTQNIKGFNSLALALAYLAKHPNRYIFPIKRRAKFPPCLPDNLETNCSNDTKRIREWAKLYPGCNWGLAHRKSRMLVADIDTSKAKGKVGDETYALLDLLNTWPETERTTTPSGGFHLIYEGWEDESHPAHIFALGENGIGLDIDSPNYSLIPGCMLADGMTYTTNGADAVRCPEWIYDLIAKNKRSGQSIDNPTDIAVDLDKPENIDWAIDFLTNDARPSFEGKLGDKALYDTCGVLKDRGISSQMGAQLLNQYYAMQPAWDLDDLIKKMDGAAGYGKQEKIGGATAEADFADEPIEPVALKNPARVAAEAKRRAEDIADGIRKPPKYQRKPVQFSMLNLTNSLHDAVMAIRDDKVHDPVFRRGPLLVRLNQAVTPRDLVAKKVRRKRGALMITSIIPDYMKLRLDQAGEFYVKAKPKKKPGPKPKEQSNGNL